jgi:hypothetical protein
MKIETPIFGKGAYDKPCELFPKIKIGSVSCVGHSGLGTKGCPHCVSFKEENTYFLPILQEHTPIVSEVACSRPCAELLLF